MHTTNYRIYYEDTDAGGVVYYANYLKFAERARTDMLRDLGINQSKLAKEEKILFVVRNVEMDLKKPARLDDVLTIKTTVTKLASVKMQMLQEVYVQDVLINTLNITIACISTEFLPTKIPQKIKDLL